MRSFFLVWFLVCFVITSSGVTQERSSIPDVVPTTRDEVKQSLNASKNAESRLPPPPLTDVERELIAKQIEDEKSTGEKPRRFGLANNARTRAFYLGDYGFALKADIERAMSSTERAPDSGFDPSFRVMLFWIVSRGNNCTYCLGHQESGLAYRGVSEEVRAALDSDWESFEPKQRAAFEFTAKLSFDPHKISKADIDSLTEFVSDSEIAELIVMTAGFNATNRWTGPMRIQQDVLYDFATPTTNQFVNRPSLIAPLGASFAKGGSTVKNSMAKSRERGDLEAWPTMLSKIEEAKKRSPHLPLASIDSAKQILLDKSLPPELSSLQWVRFLATLPRTGLDRISAFYLTKDSGTLDDRSKAIVAYVTARHDRAWYALGHALDVLRKLGLSDEQIQRLDDPESIDQNADKVLVRFVKTISTDPALTTDKHFQDMQSIMTDKQVAEAVYVTSMAASFNRITEASGLTLELR